MDIRERGKTVSDLEKVLSEYGDHKIAVYGLGAETERVLGEIGKTFQVTGLLDSYQDSGTLYGKPIISLDRAAEEQVRLILVAARPGSCRAIAKRIGGICRVKIGGGAELQPSAPPRIYPEIEANILAHCQYNGLSLLHL